MMTNAVKEQMLADMDAEVNMLMNGIMCAPRFVKVMCRNRIDEIRWMQSRIEKGKDYDTKCMPKSVGHPKYKDWPIEDVDRYA